PHDSQPHASRRVKSHYDGSSSEFSSSCPLAPAPAASAGRSSPWTCTSATSASGAFSTPATADASLACPVSTASAYSDGGTSLGVTSAAASAPSTTAVSPASGMAAPADASRLEK